LNLGIYEKKVITTNVNFMNKCELWTKRPSFNLLSQKQTLCNTDISPLTNFSKFDIGRIDKRKVYEIARPENSLSAFTLIQIAKFAK